MFFRLFLLICAVICSSSGFAQPSIYEFDYHFNIGKNSEKYSAFMVRNGDGTGFIRVNFIDDETHKPVIVDLQMKEHYLDDGAEGKQTNENILVFEGYDPQVVVGPSKLEYEPDIFWFQKNASTGIFEPGSVISTGDDGKDVEGEFTHRLLNEADLTKELVSKYFTEQDDFYENFFEEATTRVILPEQKKIRMLLLLVANTDDISIGPTCVVDKDATYNTFSQLAEFMQIQFVPKVIFGKDFSKVNVDNAISALDPNPGDMVVFYYSGHGFANIKDSYTFPFLDLRDKAFQTYGGQYTLNMEEIYKRIKAKGARLNLILSDCCNADPSQSNTISTDVATTRSSSIGWNMENCKALFLNSNPTSILMTAASKGELSAGNSTGGIFTFNFRESLEKSVGHFANNVSWTTLLNTAQQQTITKAQRTWCDKEKKIVCKQQPVYKMEQK
ncbi:MAG: caspase family protein [Bacteroidetes bacterium]|nr:caspase family protein [Bacteroidota bacterium]